MTGALIVSTTLPTIVGMGVVSKTTETMFNRRGRQAQARPRHTTVTVGVSPTRTGAEEVAAKYRKKLKSQGIPYVGRVKVRKVQGGYAITYLR